MPRTRSLAWSELRIGVLTIAALVIAAVTIFSLTGGRGFFWQQYNLKTRFVNVAGLKPGSPVRVAGVEVGSVTAVDFATDQVEVAFEIHEAHRDRITTGSTAFLGSVSLLGESAVDITLAASGTPIPEWGYVPSGRARGQITDVAETASQGIEELTGLVGDLRAGRGTIGRLVTDEQLYVELRRFVASAGDLTDGLRDGRGTVGRLLNDPKAAYALEQSLANIEALTRQINAGEGSLGRLLKDDSFSRSLTSATTNLDALVARLNTRDGTLGKLVDDPALYNRLNGVAERLEQLLAGLNEGQGTAGLLMNDRQLYENMNKVTTDLSALIAEITKDPKKYLNVRVSIF